MFVYLYLLCLSLKALTLQLGPGKIDNFFVWQFAPTASTVSTTNSDIWSLTQENNQNHAEHTATLLNSTYDAKVEHTWHTISECDSVKSAAKFKNHCLLRINIMATQYRMIIPEVCAGEKNITEDFVKGVTELEIYKSLIKAVTDKDTISWGYAEAVSNSESSSSCENDTTNNGNSLLTSFDLRDFISPLSPTTAFFPILSSSIDFIGERTSSTTSLSSSSSNLNSDSDDDDDDDDDNTESCFSSTTDTISSTSMIELLLTEIRLMPDTSSKGLFTLWNVVQEPI